MNQLVIALLEAISAEALVLAMREKKGQHWDGDLLIGLSIIQEKVDQASREARKMGEQSR